MRKASVPSSDLGNARHARQAKRLADRVVVGKTVVAAALDVGSGKIHICLAAAKQRVERRRVGRHNLGPKVGIAQRHGRQLGPVSVDALKVCAWPKRKAAVAKMLETDASQLALWPEYGGMAFVPSSADKYSRYAMHCRMAVTMPRVV